MAKHETVMRPKTASAISSSAACPAPYDPRIPHLSALLAGTDAAAAAPAGRLLQGHAGESWHDAQRHARRLHLRRGLPCDAGVELQRLQREVDGYRARHRCREALRTRLRLQSRKLPAKGPGGNEQNVLKYLLTTGAPTGPTGEHRQQDRGLRRGRSAQPR